MAGYAGMVIFGIVLLAFFIFGTLTGFVPAAVLIVFGILTVFCLGAWDWRQPEAGLYQPFPGICPDDRQSALCSAAAAGGKVRKVRGDECTEDLKKMIDSRLFLEAHIDEENQLSDPF